MVGYAHHTHASIRRVYLCGELKCGVVVAGCGGEVTSVQLPSLASTKYKIGFVSGSGLGGVWKGRGCVGVGGGWLKRH